MTSKQPLPSPRSRAAVFVSYRQWDGSVTAARVAWSLRAVGIPVWHDKTDLPPGDTARVISQALASGLSGAVLVVTDDIINSPVVKNVEWPKIRALGQDGRFTLGVLNSVKNAAGNVYAAPDHLLRRRSDRLLRRFRHYLSGIKQYRYSDDEDQFDQLAADMLRQRLHHLDGPIRERGYTHIELATRAEPSAEYAESADLTLCWDRGEGLDVGLAAQETFQRTFHLAAGALRQHTTGPIRFHGQAHLSFGLAIGASLTLGPIIQFENADGVWQVTPSGSQNTSSLTSAAHDSQLATGPVLVFIDLLLPTSDDAYDSLARTSEWSELVHIRLLNNGDRILSTDGDRLAHEIAAEIRAASARNGNAEVHLLLYAPFPLALLLGTLLNTLDVVVYEWRRGGGGQHAYYAPMFRLRPGERNPVSLPDW